MHVERSQAGDAHGWEDDSRVADPDISPGDSRVADPDISPGDSRVAHPDISPGDFRRAGRGNSPVGASRPDGPGSVGPVSAQ